MTGNSSRTVSTGGRGPQGGSCGGHPQALTYPTKDTLEIAINKQTEQIDHLKVSNDLKGIKAFQKKAKELKIDLQNALFCMEYTGIYNYIFLDFLSTNNYPIWIENPLAIKKSWGFQRGKSDRIDAKRIAQYACRFQDKAQRWQPDRSVIGKLKALVSMRERLIKSRDSIWKPLNEYKRFMPENYYASISLVLTDYKPKTHDLKDLCRRANKIHKALKGIFPCQTAEEKHRFDLLRRAYVDARVRHDVSRCKYSHSEIGSRLYPIANQAVQR